MRISSPSGFSMTTPIPEGPGLPWEPPSTYAVKTDIQLLWGRVLIREATSAEVTSPKLTSMTHNEARRVGRQEMILVLTIASTSPQVRPELWKVLWISGKQPSRIPADPLFTRFSSRIHLA